MNILRIPSYVIDGPGAVSAECAEAMAEGLKRLMNTDCVLAVTGIAGPGGGTNKKPVGTVYIAVSVPGMTECRQFLFRGDRDTIRNRSVTAALSMLIESIRA